MLREHPFLVLSLFPLRREDWDERFETKVDDCGVILDIEPHDERRDICVVLWNTLMS